VVAFPSDRVLAGMVGAGLGIEALCAFLNLSWPALDEQLVRLGLATPHDRPLRKAGSRGWSLRDTIRLIAWRVAGVHPEIIGQRLDVPRSANAVRAKARRIGIPAPARKALHKPDPSSLRDPPPDFAFASAYSADRPTPSDLCGRAAGVASVAGGVSAFAPLSPALDPASSQAPAGQARLRGPGAVRRSRGLSRPEGQRELPLLGVVGGTEARATLAQGGTAAASLPPIPCKVEDIDLQGDLGWFARVERPLMSPVAVWVAFMMVMGGLHWHDAARRLGVGPAAFRSFRPRMAIPVDHDRRKAGTVFSEAGARATLERSGYMLRQCRTSGKWFWVHKSDRATYFSPCVRKRQHQIEGRSNKITIITESMLDAEARLSQARFANTSARISA
jgi:hypothetical protein